MEIDLKLSQLKLLQKVESTEDDNVDAIVSLPTGEKRTVTFFTVKNLQSIMERHRSTGECLSGKYFWATDMVIVRDLRRVTLDAVVADMIESGELNSASGPVDES